MVLGVISDIHGNVTALRAVIDDAAGSAVAVDQWWVLGDLVALGPDPVGVLEVVSELPGVEVIRGNTERYVTRGDRPDPSFDEVRADPEMLDRLIEVAVSFAWTRGAVTEAGWFGYLDSLPAVIRTTLPDGSRLLGVHASPASDDGAGIDTRIGDSDLRRMLDGCEADVVFGGHTHDATDRMVDEVRAVNPGSVSNPSRPDGCATYALIHGVAEGHRIERRIVDYDHAAELAALDRVRHPAAGYIRRFHEPFRSARP